MGTVTEPMASLRLSVAVRYWHCARIVMEHQNRDMEFMEPVGHLLSMTAELVLKAYLLERGTTDRELGKKRIQHDLAAILRLCIENGLRLGEEDVAMLLVLRTAHLEHFHRYGPKSFAGAYTIVLPDERRALPILARIIDLVSGDPQVLRWRHPQPEGLDWSHTRMPTEAVTLERLALMSAEAERYAKAVEGVGMPHVHG